MLTDSPADWVAELRWPKRSCEVPESGAITPTANQGKRGFGEIAERSKFRCTRAPETRLVTFIFFFLEAAETAGD